mmetsp:Transcript_15887/g.55323  ORF Transcript_15887/g.55323 Transcript_15887/m.55323 type:complete len:211 (+) Transcript_15887:1929-2561(+)
MAEPHPVQRQSLQRGRCRRLVAPVRHTLEIRRHDLVEQLHQLAPHPPHHHHEHIVRRPLHRRVNDRLAQLCGLEQVGARRDGSRSGVVVWERAVGPLFGDARRHRVLRQVGEQRAHHARRDGPVPAHVRLPLAQLLERLARLPLRDLHVGVIHAARERHGRHCSSHARPGPPAAADARPSTAHRASGAAPAADPVYTPSLNPSTPRSPPV